MVSARFRFAVVSVGSFVAALAWTFVPEAARAQGMPMESGPGGAGTEWMAGLGVSSGPAYLGSDMRRTRALPMLAARWGDGWFASVAGAGYRFDLGGGLSAGPKVSLDLGRDENDATALAGMGDIPARGEIGGFVNYRLWPGMSLGGSLRAGSGEDRQGLLADLSLRGGIPLSQRVRLTGGLVATFANTQAMRSQFGVSAEQARRSGYAVYSPDAGLRDISLQIGSAVHLKSDLVLMFGLESRRLTGDARYSPITREPLGTNAFASLAMRL